jgi:hypothetical protein
MGLCCTSLTSRAVHWLCSVCPAPACHAHASSCHPLTLSPCGMVSPAAGSSVLVIPCRFGFKRLLLPVQLTLACTRSRARARTHTHTLHAAQTKCHIRRQGRPPLGERVYTHYARTPTRTNARTCGDKTGERYCRPCTAGERVGTTPSGRTDA